MKYFLLIFLPTFLFGTAQRPDLIIFEGEEYELHSNPFECYIDEENPPKELYATSSACWRGYVATYEIKNEHLYLVKFQRKTLEIEDTGKDTVRCYDKTVDLDFEGIFPGKKLPFLLSEYSGRLKIPQGEILQYVHMGYGSRYEKDLIFHVESGRITSKAIIDNSDPDPFRSYPDLQFCAIDEDVKDSADWIDARLLQTPFIEEILGEEKEFKTRGIYMCYGDADSILWIPSTIMTEDFRIKLIPPKGISIQSGAHVELKCTIVEENGASSIEVVEIEELAPGKSIHSEEFSKIYEDYYEPSSNKAVERNAEIAPLSQHPSH